MDADRLPALFNYSSFGAALINEYGTIKYANPAFLALLDIETIKTTSDNFYKLIDISQAEKGSFKKMFTGKVHNLALDKKIKRKSGAEAWISIHANIQAGENSVKNSLVILTDVTQEKAYKSETFLKSLAIDASMAGILIASIEGKIIYVNRALLEIGGFSHESELIGKMTTTFKLDLGKHEAVQEKVLKQGQWTGELQTAKKDGTPVYLLITVVLISDAEGKPVGRLTSFIDITWRKEAEAALIKLNLSLEEKNEEITHTLTDLMASQEKLEMAHKELHHKNFELDQFVYKTSHDLRSPLTTILGLLHILKSAEDEIERSNYIDLIENRITKLDKFIKSMLDYSKNIRLTLNFEKIDFNELIKECLEELAYTKNFSHLHIIVEKENTVDFYSDFFRLKVIFNNIISNAIKYQNLLLKESMLRIHIKVTESQCVINFTDNGIGIHPDYVNHIFNMFVRASTQAEGSGLGMYIVKQAVQLLNGTISLRSEYGTETEIDIVFPNVVEAR